MWNAYIQTNSRPRVPKKTQRRIYIKTLVDCDVKWYLIPLTSPVVASTLFCKTLYPAYPPPPTSPSHLHQHVLPHAQQKVLHKHFFIHTQIPLLSPYHSPLQLILSPRTHLLHTNTHLCEFNDRLVIDVPVLCELRGMDLQNLHSKGTMKGRKRLAGWWRWRKLMILSLPSVTNAEISFNTI